MTLYKTKPAWSVVLMAGAVAIAGMAAELPPLNIPVCDKPPLLDGKLDDPAWEQSAKIEHLYLINTNTPAPETSVWLMRDNAWLYIAANCRNPQMPQLDQVAHALRYGEGVNLDDSLEFFIHPTSGENDEYYHLLLNFAGVVKEQRCNREGLRDYGWSPPWRTATQRLTDGWTAETAIPLFMFAGRDSDRMLINICRNLVTVELDEQGAVTKKTVVWSTLRPDNKGGFHGFANLLALGNMEELKPDPGVFAPHIVGASVTGVRQDNGKNFYDLRVVLDIATSQAGAVNLNVMEDFGADEVKTLVQPVNLNGRSELELKIPTDDLRARKIMIVLSDAVDGRLLAQRMMGSTDLNCVISKDKQPFFRKGAVSAAGSATFVVAAADAPDRIKERADFICEGVDDHIVINSAIAELPATGGRVHLTTGTFSIGSVEGTFGGINIFRSNVLLTGEGTGTRLILQDGLTDVNVIWICELDGFVSNVTIRDLYINGNKENQTAWVRARSGWAGNNGVKSFGMWGAMGRTPVNVRVENCRIEDCVLMAVMLTGEAVEVIDCYFTGNFGSHVIELLGDSGRIEGCTLRVKNGDRATFGFATDHSHYYHIVNNKIFIDAGGTLGSCPINNWPPKRYGGESVTNMYYGIISGNMVINNGYNTGPVLIQGYMDVVNNNIFRGVPVVIAGMGVTFEHNMIVNGSLEVNSPHRGNESRIFINGNNLFNSGVTYKDGNVVWGVNPGYTPENTEQGPPVVR